MRAYSRAWSSTGAYSHTSSPVGYPSAPGRRCASVRARAALRVLREERRMAASRVPWRVPLCPERLEHAHGAWCAAVRRVLECRIALRESRHLPSGSGALVAPGSWPSRGGHAGPCVIASDRFGHGARVRSPCALRAPFGCVFDAGCAGPVRVCVCVILNENTHRTARAGG